MGVSRRVGGRVKQICCGTPFSVSGWPDAERLLRILFCGLTVVQLSLFAFMRSRRRWRTISYAKISHALLYASPMRNSCTIVNTFIPPEYRDLNADTLGVVVLIFNIVCIACHLLIDLISIHRLLRGISRFACRYSHILGLATNVSRDNSRLLFFSVTLQTPTVAILRCP